MTEIPTRRRDTRSLAFFFASLALVLYIGTLVTANYLSSVELRAAALERVKAENQKRARALSHFYRERAQDLAHLAEARSFSNYFANRALGMSMAYGLRASFQAMSNQLDKLARERLVEAKPIFERIVLVDNEGMLLADTREKLSEPLYADLAMTRLETTGYPGFAVLRGNDAPNRIVLSRPLIYKHQPIGHFIAWIDHNRIHDELLFFPAKADGQVTVVASGTEYVGLEGVAHGRLPQPLPMPGDMAYDEPVTFSAGTVPGESSEYLGIKSAVPGTPFALVQMVPVAKVHGYTAPTTMLVTLVSLALVLLTTAGILVRNRTQMMVLKTRYEAADQQHVLVEEKNLALRAEMKQRQEIEESLRASEDRFRGFAESASDWLWELDANLNFTYISDRILDLSGYPPSWFIGHNIAEVYGRLTGAAVSPGSLAFVLDRKPFRDLELPLVRAGGEPAWMRISGSPRQNENGEFAGYRGVGTDVTGFKKAQDNIDKLSLAVEQSPAPVYIVGTDGAIEYVNPKGCEVTGYSAAELLGQRHDFLASDRHSAQTYETLWRTASAGEQWRGELQSRKKDGSLFWTQTSISPVRDREGHVAHYLLIAEDVTLKKDYEERLLRQANYDHLTGLPNRLLGLDRLSHALLRAKRYDTLVTLMYVDLDHFKDVNDTAGHTAGDQLLIDAAQRLSECVRTSDTVARLGGDEFLIIMSDLVDTSEPEAMVKRILAAFTKPFLIHEQEFFVTASLGLSVFPDDGHDPHILLRNADAALYQAKEQGRHGYQFFTREMNERAQERLRLEGELRYALSRGEFSLDFQPLVEARGHQIAGAEALLRWRNEKLGLVGPDRFIPLAEDTGLIVEIGEWVLDSACREAVRWRAEAAPNLSIAVNVSSRQFQGGNLVATVARVLADSGLPAHALELEITERLLIEDVGESSAILQGLKDLGVQLSLDDFGTGHSALGYLKRFPFDVLKIDRMFVKDITDNAEDKALATAIIAMAHALGLRVIGEGVEMREQANLLQERGCDILQGYLFSKPLDTPGFEALLKGSTPWPQRARGGA